MSAEAISIVSATIASLAAVGAWAAVLVNRWNARDTIRAQVNIAARSSRAAVVSANRQKWIDAVREDVAEFSAVRSQVAVVKHAASFERSDKDVKVREERQFRAKLHMLYARVEMRLNHDEEDHLALLDLMRRYWQSANDEDDLAMRAQARGIFRAEWTRLKKEASGLDPFVRETVPERK